MEALIYTQFQKIVDLHLALINDITITLYANNNQSNVDENFLLPGIGSIYSKFDELVSVCYYDTWATGIISAEYCWKENTPNFIISDFERLHPYIGILEDYAEDFLIGEEYTGDFGDYTENLRKMLSSLSEFFSDLTNNHCA